MVKVIFDSSFLLAAAETPTPWEEAISELLGGFEPVLLDCVRVELERISKGVDGKSKLAKVALEMSRGFQPGACGRANVDDEIASAAISARGAVATVDRRLTSSLRSMGVQVVGLSNGRVALRR